jgi:hypothetical protein
MSNQRKSSPVTRVERWAARIDRLPRLTRVVLTLLITLELAGLTWPVAAFVFGVKPIDPDPGPATTLLFLIVVPLGLVFYGVGWWAMVGFDMNPDQPWRATAASARYLVAGGVCLLLILLLVSFGLLFGYVL